MTANFSRRNILSGMAVASIALSLPGVAAAAEARTVERFQVRSSDGVNLSVEAQGDPSAPEILFVHGLRQSRLSWDKQFADPALAGFRLVRFDLRGHGDSDKPVSAGAYADADRWADDVAAVIAGAKLRRPVVVGWSLGGYVAGAYLRRHGAKSIAGINLVAAVSRFSPDTLTPLAGTYARTTSSTNLAERTAATAAFLADCFRRSPPPAELQRMLVVNGMMPRTVNDGLGRLALTDLEPVYRAYPGPILITHGVHDRLVRAAMAERVAALSPRFRLSLYADSGHSPFYEEADKFGRELAAFVTASQRRGAM